MNEMLSREEFDEVLETDLGVLKEDWVATMNVLADALSAEVLYHDGVCAITAEMENLLREKGWIT